MTRIFIVGSYVQGLTLTVPRMPLAGENLVGGGFDLGPGGKGTNQAIAAARLGTLLAIGRWKPMRARALILAISSASQISTAA